MLKMPLLRPLQGLRGGSVSNTFPGRGLRSSSGPGHLGKAFKIVLKRPKAKILAKDVAKVLASRPWPRPGHGHALGLVNALAKASTGQGLGQDFSQGP